MGILTKSKICGNFFLVIYFFKVYMEIWMFMLTCGPYIYLHYDYSGPIFCYVYALCHVIRKSTSINNRFQSVSCTVKLT